MNVVKRINDRTDITNSILFFAYGISMLCHLAVFGIAIYAPSLNFNRIKPEQIISVDLISIPIVEEKKKVEKIEKVEEVIHEKIEPEKEEIIPTKSEEVKEPEPVKSDSYQLTEITQAPEPKPEPIAQIPEKPNLKESLKKKTFKKAVVQRPEAQPDTLKETLDRIRRKVRIDQATQFAQNAYMKKSLDLIDIYKAEIQERIRRNWAYLDQFTQGRNDLESVIVITISKEGQIMNQWFERKSGDVLFDNSVMNAVKKSNPLPPLPEEYFRPSYTVGLRFNLSDLQKRGYMP